MIKGVFFDMDGVITDSEIVWVQSGVDDMLVRMFGKDIWEKHFQTAQGIAIQTMYEIAIQNGAKYDYDQYNRDWNDLAKQVYVKSPVTPDLEDLFDWISKQNIKIGIVSSSPIEWVDSFLSRLRNKQVINGVFSVNNHPKLKPKPSPDPYIYAMSEFGISPSHSIIVEDSPAGVTAAKSSGGHTICFTAYHLGKDKQLSADSYASSMIEVKNLIESMI